MTAKGKSFLKFIRTGLRAKLVTHLKIMPLWLLDWCGQIWHTNCWILRENK